MKKNSVLRKVLAVSLSAAMLLGTGFTTVGSYVGTGGISVSAADTSFWCSDLNDGSVGIYGVYGNKFNVVIPTHIGEKTVTNILYSDRSDRPERFCGDTNILSVTIPDTVKMINYYTFKNCSSIIKLNLGNGINTIGKLAFGGCNSLETLVLPDSLTSIGEYAFADCNSLETVSIGSGLDNFNLNVFSSCVSMRNINVSEENAGYSSIDGVLFDKDQMILMYYPVGRTDKEYIIPNGTIVIYPQAFSIGGARSSTNLESIVCPNSLKTIGGSAFSNLKSLKTIRLGKNIKTIENDAFYGCDNLTDVYYDGNEDEWKKISIGSYNDPLTNATIHFNYKAFEPLENTSALSAEAIDVGDTVEITASAKGGSGDYEYEILYKKEDDFGWATLQNYSTNNISAFKPAQTGTYNIRVSVKDSNGTMTPKIFSLVVDVKGLKNLSSISSDRIALGDSVDVNCVAKDGNAPYSYQILYRQKSSSTWSSLQSYSTNVHAVFTPANAKPYEICVKVKDSTGKEMKKYFNITVVDNKLKNTSTLSSSSIELGNTVTVNADASGSTGFYQYAVYTKKTSDTKWSCQQSFKSNQIVTVKPKQATSYDICVKVKDNRGTVVKKYFVLEVTDKADKLSNNSTISDTKINLGEELTVSASANGSTGFYKYAVSYKGVNDTSWTTVQHHSSKSIVTIKPVIIGEYSVRVSVRDSLDNIAEKYFTVTVVG